MCPINSPQTITVVSTWRTLSTSSSRITTRMWSKTMNAASLEVFHTRCSRPTCPVLMTNLNYISRSPNLRAIWATHLPKTSTLASCQMKFHLQMGKPSKTGIKLLSNSRIKTCRSSGARRSLKRDPSLSSSKSRTPWTFIKSTKRQTIVTNFWSRARDSSKFKITSPMVELGQRPVIRQN